jgi:hypothetical protein
MVQQQQRRETPKLFLDASLIPLEKALVGRAEILEQRGVPEFKAVIRNEFLVHGLTDPNSDILAAILVKVLSTEFRQIAEELHYW